MHLTEAIIKENPNLTIFKAPSFDARQDILVKQVPKLGMEAALKAIKEWGQDVSRIDPHIMQCAVYIICISVSFKFGDNLLFSIVFVPNLGQKIFSKCGILWICKLSCGYAEK